MKKYLFIFFFLCCCSAFSQTMKISGTVLDTAAKKPLQYATAMAVKLSDSSLVKFSRTGENGVFVLEKIPVDTYQVIISHAKFGEVIFIVVGSEKNSVFDFGKIIIPPRTYSLAEVTILGFKDPVYFKGDTLVYNADSFKVKPNATVEDLLKKLPGMKVDVQGKITVQGKEIDQVLVDGDEFFGADPTIATKNLNATAVQSVEVFEKKNENASATGEKELLNILNLQLKEDAKKGYFGKVSAASDFDKFYEGEFLANKFKGSQKISVFALATNTPHSRFGFSDMFKYGLNNEMNMQVSDDGESRMFFSSDNSSKGIPKTIKTGFYYTDKLSNKTKLTLNYTYSPNWLTAYSETRSQYFFEDTSYVTKSKGNSVQSNESHSVNFSINQTLDSLTELEITPKWKLTHAKNDKYDAIDFLTSQDTLTRSTTTENNGKGKSYEIGSALRLKRKFKKKDRILSFRYNFNFTNNDMEGILKSTDVFYNNSFLPNDTIDQQKTSKSQSQLHNATVTYTEPLTKKMKLEFTYDYSFNFGTQDKTTLKYANGSYSEEDSVLSNNFENTKNTHRIGAKYIYETKKTRLSIGAFGRQINMLNNNLVTNVKLTQLVNSILPNAGFSYKFNDNQRFNLDYNVNSNPPGISQLQPVPDNSNPNQIKLGNPNLVPTMLHIIGMRFNSFKPLTERNFWSNASFYFPYNDFSNSISYDSIGRTITQPINVKGNQRIWAYMGGEVPFFDKVLKLIPSGNLNYHKTSSFINNVENVTEETSVGAGMDVDIEFENIEISLGGNYDYSISSSTLSEESNKPYSSQDYSASFWWRLPKNFSIETEASYNIDVRQGQGYDLHYLLWNATFSKTLLKKENLIFSIEATDMLNQNISNQRDVQDNVITDTKTNIIGRYILFRLVYKFNSEKKKEEDEDW